MHVQCVSAASLITYEQMVLKLLGSSSGDRRRVLKQHFFCLFISPLENKSFCIWRWKWTAIMWSITSCIHDEWFFLPVFARSVTIIPSRLTVLPDMLCWNNYHLLFTGDWMVRVGFHHIIIRLCFNSLKCRWGSTTPLHLNAVLRVQC